MTTTNDPRELQRTYGTPSPSDELRATIDRRRTESEQLMKEAAAARAASEERAIKARSLAQPGATPQLWEKERAGILAKAREHAALAGDDLARRRNAQRYQ